MYFKIYRDFISKRLRTVHITLYANDGALLDETCVFGYAPFFSLRVKLRQRAMVKLQKAMQKLSKPV